VYKGAGHCFVDAKGNLDRLAVWDAQCRTLSFLARHLAQDRTK
jgi:hypothetical protein